MLTCEQYSHLFYNHPDAILIIKNNKIVKCNKSAIQLFGYSDYKELIGQAPFENSPLIQKDGVNSIKKGNLLLNDIMEKLSLRFEWLYRKKNDELFYAEVILLSRQSENEQTISAIIKDITAEKLEIETMKKKEDKIKYLLDRDDLTKLYNKKYFFQELEKKIISNYDNVHNNKKMAIILMDINEFKGINDNLGYFIGDNILKIVANRLKNCFEEVDLIARFGGDEFIVLIPEVENKEELSLMGEKVLDIFNDPFKVNDNIMHLSVSIGISIYPDHGYDVPSLIQSSEIAMYKVKELKCNSFEIFNEDHIKKVREHFLIDSHLRYALDNGEFDLKYQPIINTNTELIIGLEALIRWTNEELGNVPPDKFIHIAENNGMIIPIGEWVLRSACEQLKKWHDIGYENIFMSINISIKQLEQKDFASLIEELINTIGLSSENLVLEITETVYMENLQRIYNNLKGLNELGVKLSIDDFGTGYSSLGQLKRLEISKLKIDKSFIQDINIDANNTKIVSAIIAMAKSLNLNIVAEGVEKEEHLLFLKENKCDMLQGYFFSKPLTNEGIEELFKKLK